MKTIASIGLLSVLAACGGGEPAPVENEESAPAETPDLAKPITEPLRMREVIYHDLDVQKGKARDREDLFDQAVSGNR